MKNKLNYYFGYGFLLLLFFQLSRFVFVLFYFEDFKSVFGWGQKINIFAQGLKLDLSTTGYLLLLPTLVLLLQSFFQSNWSKICLRVYTQLIFFILSVLTVADLFLYRQWGVRLDSTPFRYLENPGEALNFAPPFQLATSLLLTVLFWWVFTKMYRTWLAPKLNINTRNFILQPLAFLLLGASLIFPIRGGIGLTPLNLSHVFFSTTVFANQATINVPWNVIYSWSEMNKLQERYQYMPEEVAQNKFSSFYPTDTTFTPILRVERPDIVLLILESFTAKLVDRKLDNIFITPNLNQLTREGIYFSNCYASGSRTDKGLVATLSAYPAMPRSSIINYQQKSRKLPSLIRDLKQAGYQSKFYYGGDINFANQKSYLLLNEIDQIIDKRNFSPADYHAKWGAHDHLVFEKLIAELPNTASPFFHILLSLSSHEPFTVPMETVFPGNDGDHKFANSAHYTDQVLGQFVQQLKASPKWDNMLLIILADHGIQNLDNSAFYSPEKFKIPLLWLGGALAKGPTKIETYVAQTDLTPSLLKQLKLDTRSYAFSKDIFSPVARSFAYYSFNNGAGFVSDSFISIFNNHDQKHILLKGQNNRFPKFPEQVYLQRLSGDYFEK